MIATKSIKNFPLAYRSLEMETLTSWLKTGQSGSVTGLPGCGRSNLLDFLCHRPDVLREQQYLGTEADQVVVIPVDLNHLPTYDTATFYRVILRALHLASDRLPQNLHQSITGLYLEYRTSQDPFITQSGLYDALYAFQSEEKRVALVFNYFDRFCQEADRRLFATLRGLRDSFKEMLSFIVGMSREIRYLPTPEALGDLYPLLDSNVCWVGPMNEADSRWVIEQALYAVPDSPHEAEIKKFLTLSGGYPVLLRYITAWWSKQTPKPPIETWPDLLLDEHTFEHRLNALWNGLTQEEQSALMAVQLAMSRIHKKKNLPGIDEQAIDNLVTQTVKLISRNHGQIMPRLVTKGICQQTEQGWQILSQLWADYISRLELPNDHRGKLELKSKTGDVMQDGRPIKLAPQEDALLKFLLKHPYERHDYGTLILEVWPADHDPSSRRQDLFQLVRSVRRKVETDPSRPRYLKNWTDQRNGGYQLYPEGKPGA